MEMSAHSNRRMVFSGGFIPRIYSEDPRLADLDVLIKGETHAGHVQPLPPVLSYILIPFGPPEKLLVIQLVKKLASCMEPTLYLLLSQLNPIVTFTHTHTHTHTQHE
jgi:hypothetical protein